MQFVDTGSPTNQRGEKTTEKVHAAGIPDFRSRRTIITQCAVYERPRNDLSAFSCDDTELADRFRELPA